ncbi:hypothetical protein DFH06DRAFT_1052805 [Mycena polygramma]|nr:hypothetical protein DFH06DRAFT_1052805 [Mycena polygramma]
MSSVEQLRARIAEVSTEIVLQKKVLKTLRKAKSLAQRQLNAALDPVARLPVEISSEIFLQSLPSFAERKPSVQYTPILLLRICHAWRNIALLTSELWSGIQITFPSGYAPGFEEGVQTWLRRASNRPLSVSLRGPGGFEPGATDIVWRHAQQIERLDLCYQKEDESDDEGEDFDEDDFYMIDLLGGTPGSLPSLKALAIRGLTSLRENHEYTGAQILKLLRLASNLVECSFESVSPIDCFHCGEQLAIPTLRQLSFGEGDSDENILNYLSLPGLEVMSLSLYDTSISNLLSLLKRSAPPLRELVMKVDPGEDFTPLDQCLRLVPTLEKFQMWRTGSPILQQILTALAESPSLLPRLHSLTITVLNHNLNSSACWTALLLALSSRRAHVRDVHVEVLPDSRGDEVTVRPPDHILSALRDLTADGMQIYIGSQGGTLNFL